MDLLRRPRVFGLLGIPLTAATIWAIYNPSTFGIPSNHASLVMLVAIPLAVWLVFVATAEPPELLVERAAALGRLQVEEASSTYREEKTARTSVPLKRIDAVLAPALVHALEQVGSGQVLATYQLKRDAAYMVVVAADALGTSDFVSVLFVLEEPAPLFVARPYVAGEPGGDRYVPFPKDAAFTERYFVEMSNAAQNVKAVRKMLGVELREALLEDPRLWLHVNGKTASLTLFGSFEPAVVQHLVEIADVFYAAYGKGGSNASLLTPDGDAPVKKKKAKAKAKKPEATGEADDAEA